MMDPTGILDIIIYLIAVIMALVYYLIKATIANPIYNFVTFWIPAAAVVYGIGWILNKVHGGEDGERHDESTDSSNL